MGKGKTERFVINSDPGTVVTSTVLPDGTFEKVPVVTKYKYLGSMALDWDAEFAKRSGCAWAALKSNHGIWKSHVKMKTKRQLFRAMVEPIVSYSLAAWPMTQTRADQLDGCFGRMLRFACGLPPAFISRDIVHTEKLYDGMSFLSAMVAKARAVVLGGAVAEHVKGVRVHQCARLLLYEPDPQQYPLRRHKHAQETLQKTVLRDYHVAFPEQLATAAKGTGREQLEAEAVANESRMMRISARRLRSLLEYFPESSFWEGRRRRERKNELLGRKRAERRTEEPVRAESIPPWSFDEMVRRCRMGLRHFTVFTVPSPAPALENVEPAKTPSATECRHTCANKATCKHVCCKRHL
jgi:hypothetical protein